MPEYKEYMATRNISVDLYKIMICQASKHWARLLPFVFPNKIVVWYENLSEIDGFI